MNIKLLDRLTEQERKNNFKVKLAIFLTHRNDKALTLITIKNTLKLVKTGRWLTFYDRPYTYVQSKEASLIYIPVEFKISIQIEEEIGDKYQTYGILFRLSYHHNRLDHHSATSTEYIAGFRI